MPARRTPPLTGRTPPLALLYAHPLDMYDQLLFPVTVAIQSPYIHEKALYLRKYVLICTYYPENSDTEHYLHEASLYVPQMSPMKSPATATSPAIISVGTSDTPLRSQAISPTESLMESQAPSPPSPVLSLAQSLMGFLASVMPLALMSGPAAGLPLDHAHVHDPDPDPDPVSALSRSPSPLNSLKI